MSSWLWFSSVQSAQFFRRAAPFNECSSLDRRGGWKTRRSQISGWLGPKNMHPPLTLHRHPMCAEIIEEFQKCHLDHPVGKFFGECTELKIKLDRCFRQEKAVKRKANFEQSKKFKERLQAYRKEMAAEKGA